MKDVYQRARGKKGYARRDVSNKQARAMIKAKFFKELKNNA